MGYLEKNFIIHSRGEDGKLLPIDYYVEDLKASIQFIPLSRGAIMDIGVKLNQEINKGKESNITNIWCKIIAKQLVNPKITAEELEISIKPIIKNGQIIDMLDIFVNALYEISGVNLQDNSTVKKN